MKRILIILMAFCLVAPAVNAELTKEQEKKVSKMAKSRSKELSKEGYVVMGGVPLRDALEKHLATVENGAMEQIGTGRSKSKNGCRQMCLAYAMAEYASKSSSRLKGRVVLDTYGNQINFENDPEFDRFYAAFERLTQKEIRGEMKESFSVMKEMPDGSYSVIMYLTIDPTKAAESGEKAIRAAAAESGISRDYAEMMLEDWKNKK